MRKNSKQREEIKKILMSTTSHPDAEWVYEKMKPAFPRVSLATVYRNLTLMVEEGQAQRIRVADGPDRFDGNSKTHYHFMCEQCGCVYDLSYPVIQDFEEQVQQLTGFIAKKHTVLFSGICNKCEGGV